MVTPYTDVSDGMQRRISCRNPVSSCWKSNSVKKVGLAGITTEVGRIHPHARVRAIGEASSLDEECICYAVNVN